MKLKPGIVDGHYCAFIGNEKVGEIAKRVESYRGIRGGNGRRMGQYTYWSARTADGRAVTRKWDAATGWTYDAHPDPRPAKLQTRREAMQALEAVLRDGS